MISRAPWGTYGVSAALALAVACSSSSASKIGAGRAGAPNGDDGSDAGGGPPGMSFVGGDASVSSGDLAVAIQDASKKTIATVASNCSGGCEDVTAVASGGAQPYTFVWSDGAKGATRRLCPRASSSLTVTATDTGTNGGELGRASQSASATLAVQCPAKPPTAAIGCPPLAVGAGFACAISSTGGLKCWGGGGGGEAPDGSDGAMPYDVPGLTSGVACIAAGEAHKCALTTAGAVKCWGFSLASDWGDTPSDVPNLGSGVVQIASGEYDTCALLTSGALQCWGGGGEFEATGPFGLPQRTLTVYGKTPVAISGVPAGITGFQMADGFGCFLSAGGGVQCWGENTFGELGNGTNAASATPVAVNGLGSGVTWLSANGSTAACAVLTGGHLKCWGQGVLANSPNTPTDVPGLTSGVASVSVGGENETCVIMTDGTVQCWGAGGSPVPIPGVSGATYVATNEGCSCAIVGGGKIMCWGSCPGNESGQSAAAQEVPGF